MRHNKLFIAMLTASALLTGCGGGSDGDDVSITIETGTDTPVEPPVDTSSPRALTDSEVETLIPAEAPSASLSGVSYFIIEDTDEIIGELSGTFTSGDVASSKPGAFSKPSDKAASFTLTSDITWVLNDEVIIGDGNETTVETLAQVDQMNADGISLVIEAGTNIVANSSGVLLITRGSEIWAEGTAEAPITFSSQEDDDFNGLGEWGGVVIQGFAPQYGAGNAGACFGEGDVCNVAGEGGDFIGVFGGNDPADSSGLMQYVRIAEAGRIASANNEINGLTLQGVGHGTTLDHIQVHNNLDDGVEWFGGTVNITHLVLTGNDDDDIDFDEGYMGNIQYALIRKDPAATGPQGSNDPRGIEANSSDGDFVPQTAATLANITVIGSEVNKAENSKGSGGQPGMRLRGSVTANIFNTAVSNFEDCVRIDDSNTDESEDGTIESTSTVSLVNVIGDCDDEFYAKRAADSEENTNVNTILSFTDTWAIREGDAQLDAPTAIAATDNGSGFVFDQTDFIGAVDPSEETPWWDGWIIPGSLSNPVDDEPDFVSCNTDGTVCSLSGLIDEDYTLSANVEWLLLDEVVVGTGNETEVNSQADVDAVKAAGVTLTIEPGTHVRGRLSGVLLVTRGSELIAQGTSVSPITFSSAADDDFDGLGEWGGVVIQGFAPQYGAGDAGACFGEGVTCNVAGEGGDFIGVFGGNDPADDSGALRYVRIAEAGRIASANNEINGLTLQGVGHGTSIEFVQVHGNQDDGIEWFGGTVNAKYLVLTNNDDDDIDFDEGYMGNIQHVIIRKDPEAAGPQGSNDPRGIEANSSDGDFVPQTEGALSNVLIIGSDVNKAANSKGSGGQPGMRLRGSVTARLYNTAVSNFTDCVRVDDSNTDESEDGTIESVSNVTLTNVIGTCDDDFYAKRDADAEVGLVGGVTEGAIADAVAFDAAYALTNAEATVAEVDPVEVDNGSGFEFDNTTYIGPVAPGTAAGDAWWAGWVIPGSLD